eukprot:2087765-Pyramimonas_sp.AAC.3
MDPRRTRLSDHALLTLLVPESAAPTRRWRTKPPRLTYLVELFGINELINELEEFWRGVELVPRRALRERAQRNLGAGWS